MRSRTAYVTGTVRVLFRLGLACFVIAPLVSRAIPFHLFGSVWAGEVPGVADVIKPDFPPAGAGVGRGPADCAVVACPSERNFIIAYSDRGLDDHDLGRVFQLAARTHEREIRTRSFPGVPAVLAADRILTVHVSTVTELRALLSVGNIAYFAYFGHSANEWMGALLIGQADAHDTNLTNAEGPNNTPVTSLVPSLFRSDARIRLFGCRGAYGSNSIAEQMSRHFQVPVDGYANEGGSIGTADPRLGHGLRPSGPRDIAAKIPGDAPSVWLVPLGGVPRFRRF